MFAAKRNIKVIGRTIVLLVSISTRNGFNQIGALSGRKCAIIFFFEYIILLRIINIHSGTLNDAVKIMCLVDLNIYGISPEIFIKMIKKNSILFTNNIDLRLFSFVYIISVEIYKFIFIISKFILLYFSQNKFNVSIKTMEYIKEFL